MSKKNNILIYKIKLSIMYIWISPMDWITDAAYRYIVEKIFDKFWDKKDKLISVTEFMSADWFFKNSIWVAKHLLNINFKDNWKITRIVQIFWGNEETLIYTAKWVYENLDYDLVELNIWCPSPKICVIGWGSWMLRDKEKTLEIIKNLSKTVNGNFSIKTRIGLNEEDKKDQMDFLIKASEYCKIITIHGRTFEQWHVWEVDWEFIYDIKKRIWNKTILIGNGWVKAYEDALKKIWILDWISIGQAGIWNPFVIARNCCKNDINYRLYKFNILKEHFLVHWKVYIWYEMIKNYILLSKKVDQLKVLREKLVIPQEFIKRDINDLITYIEDKKLTKPTKEFRKHIFAYLKFYPWNAKIKQEIIKIDNFFELLYFIDNLIIKCKF